MISIVIPTYNQAEHLQKTLSVLSKQIAVGNIKAEIVVVNNGSTDGTVDIISKYNVKYIEFTKTRSPFAARNRGVHEAVYPIIAFLDTKCIPTASYLPCLRKLLTDSFRHIIAGQITPTGVTISSSPFSIAYAVVHVKTDPKFSRGQTSALTGNMLVRKEVFQALGGFSEVRSGGDIDFSNRARAAGYAIEYQRDLCVTYAAKTKTEVISFLKRISKNGQNARNLLSLRPPNPRYINMRLEDIGLDLPSYRYFQLYLNIWYIRWLKYIYQYI